jgi:hypothetical protein
MCVTLRAHARRAASVGSELRDPPFANEGEEREGEGRGREGGRGKSTRKENSTSELDR